MKVYFSVDIRKERCAQSVRKSDPAPVYHRFRNLNLFLVKGKSKFNVSLINLHIISNVNDFNFIYNVLNVQKYYRDKSWVTTFP